MLGWKIVLAVGSRIPVFKSVAILDPANVLQHCLNHVPTRMKILAQ